MLAGAWGIFFEGVPTLWRAWLHKFPERLGQLFYSGLHSNLTMKITDVEAIELRLPAIVERTAGTQDTLLIRIHTDEGIIGVGEVDSSPRVSRAIIDAPISHTI